MILGLSTYLKLKVGCFTGGSPLSEDRACIKNGVQVAVGTPGRTYDLIRNKILDTNHVKIIVIDEADEMLDKGFKAQMSDILQNVPSDVQIALFSATLPSEILEITTKFMRDPATILVKKEELTLDGIVQYYVALDKEEYKFESLIELYKNLGKLIIFFFFFFIPNN